MTQTEQSIAKMSDPDGSIFLPRKEHEDPHAWRDRNELAIMLGRGIAMACIDKDGDEYYLRQQELSARLEHEYDEIIGQGA